MTTEQWKLHAIVTPSGQIYQVSSLQYDPGIELAKIKGDGKLSPQFVAKMKEQQSFKVTSTAIAAVLTVFGNAFKYFDAPVTLYYAKHELGAAIATGAVHKSVTMARCCFVPTKTSASDGKEATIDFDLYPIATGDDTSPVTLNSSVSLPAITVANQVYTVGAATANGTSINGLEDITINYGYKVNMKSSNGSLYTTFASYEEFAPTISFKTHTPFQFGGLTGTGVTQASHFWLRKKAPNGGGNVPAGTAEHIKFTITSGFFQPANIDDDDERTSTDEIECHPVDDGTNAIMAISLASTIA